MLAVIKYEDLSDIVLVGHSYGGMVATGVADRARDQVSQLIYLDAFVPRDGQRLWDLLPPEALKRMLEAMKAGDGWRVRPNPCPTDTSEADLKWILPRRLPQSVRTAEMPLRGPPATSSSMPLHDSSFGSSRRRPILERLHAYLTRITR